MGDTEDLLDVFAAAVLIGLASNVENFVGHSKYVDHISRACYSQAESMLRIRKEFVNQGGSSSE